MYRKFSEIETRDYPDSKFRLTSPKISFDRDRYEGLPPFEHNRVRLTVPEGQNDYINASYISLGTLKDIRSSAFRFIATQVGEQTSTISIPFADRVR